MSDHGNNRHPDLFELAAWAEGNLTGEAASDVEGHVAECAICSLELEKLERFAGIGGDEELAKAADWEAAETELSFPGGNMNSPDGSFSGARAGSSLPWRWLAPVAVAAVLVVAFLPGLLQEPELIPDGGSPLRGGGESTQVISPVAPLGEIAGPPPVFAWESDSTFDFFVLKIFTPELDPVFEQSGIRSGKRAVTDSLLVSLRTGQVYLWTVTGHMGLEPRAASDPARFEISDIPPQR